MRTATAGFWTAASAATSLASCAPTLRPTWCRASSSLATPTCSFRGARVPRWRVLLFSFSLFADADAVADAAADAAVDATAAAALLRCCAAAADDDAGVDAANADAVGSADADADADADAVDGLSLIHI
eukprot:3127545-Rhodomonas_salina.2